MSEHVVLCRPEGGFNDILCQIELCWRYADAHERVLVVDTAVTTFGDEFENYFRVAGGSRAELRLTAERLRQLNSASTLPEAVRGRLDAYEKTWSDAHRSYVDTRTGQVLRFDPTRRHPEACLLHHQHGGGTVSLDALRRLRLQPWLSRHIRSRIGALGDDYDAIHVRNTDYVTDVDRFFAGLAGTFNGRRLLVCSDDAKVIDLARATFRRAEVVTVTEVPDLGGRPIHHHAEESGLPKRDINRDMLTDLFALASASRLYISRVMDGPGGRLPYRQLSGFSYLAGGLKADPVLLRSLQSD